jgi:predicted  nucleic acid-binding Zn-ribbon protein
MSLREMGFSLEQEVPVMEEELSDVTDEMEEIKRRRKELDEDADNFKSQKKYLEKRWNELQADRVELEAKIERFDGYVENWESTRFVVRELTFGESQNLKDIVSSESFDVDVELQEIEGTPLQGLYRSELLKMAVEEMPSDAPNDPNDLPEILGDWLMEKCESINSVGDTEVGNLSLDDAINSEN